MLYVIYNVVMYTAKKKYNIFVFIDVMVGFELTSYRISEMRNSEEICINGNSSGIPAEFEINIKTNLTSKFRYWNQSMV